MEYHGTFIPFKNQLYSKPGSPIFLLFGSWSLEYLYIWVSQSFSDNYRLATLADVQRLYENSK